MTTSVYELDLPEIDQMIGDRAETLAALRKTREENWVARVPLGFAVTRHEDVTAILRDRRFHSAISLLPQMGGMTFEDDDEFLARRRRSILAMEGDEHARLRRLVAPAFTPKSADRLRPFMREVVNGLVDEVAPRGQCDLVADICDPYPIPIICQLLGAPRGDWKLFSRWATDIFRIFNNNLQEDMPVINAASEELDAYIGDLIAERRRNPREDLLTDLIAVEEEGDKLSTDELVMLAEAILLAGTDTTRNQLACSVALFTGHTDQWDLLAEKPELAPRAVEESMRYLGAVRGTARVASEDIEYRGVLFPEGTLVMTSLGAANYDDDVFPEPDRFDITRPATGVQMTFGSGIHFCLGAALARAELQEALPILARRMRNLSLASDIVWKPSTVGIWGPERLPLRFTSESV